MIGTPIPGDYYQCVSANPDRENYNGQVCQYRYVKQGFENNVDFYAFVCLTNDAETTGDYWSDCPENRTMFKRITEAEALVVVLGGQS